MPTPSRPRHKAAILLLTLLTSLAILPLGGTPPAWWTQSDKAVLILTDSPNDFGAINQGQLKHIATQAAEHLNEELPGGAGTDLNGYIYGEAFTDTENATDFAVANIGQVKFIAKKFYDRLISVGYTDAYPWADSGDPANDHGLANIGQLKALFAFDVSAPDEGDLPQWWIDHHFPGQSSILPEGDQDGDGDSNLDEYLADSRPDDFYARPDGVLEVEIEVISGSGQSAMPGNILAAPLLIQVKDSTTNASVAGAPIKFYAKSGHGELATSETGETQLQQTVHTDSLGNAEVYWLLPDHSGLVYIIATPQTDTAQESKAQFLARSRGAEIEAGRSHSAVLTEGGTLLTWGSDFYGELGRGDITHQWQPGAVPITDSVITCSLGYTHSLAVDELGTAWSWGWNAYLQLGTGTVPSSSHSPIAISGLSSVVEVAAGYWHSLALLADGTVRAWGQNYSGELGDGTNTNRSTPVQVSGLSNIVAIEAGESFSLALDSEGNVWAWGWGSSGRLGTGNTQSSSIPIKLPTLSSVVTINAGIVHSLAITDDGNVWAWGHGDSGRLGNGLNWSQSTPVLVSSIANVREIAAGLSHSIAITDSNEVFA